MEINTRQFVNGKDDIVRQAQKGLSILLPWAKYDEENNIFAMKPLESHKNKVKLICGGGSGHEPAHAGYICEQILYASVNGPIFSSPSIQHILQTLESIIQTDKDQILILIKKYGGDIINFTNAIQTIKQKYQNIKIEALQIGDDIALEGKDITPRGLAGTCLVYKILGALSSKQDITQLMQIGKSITESLYTLGVSFGACTIPGVGVLHHLQQGQIELGMGIHGEKGRQIIDFQNCQHLIDTMLQSLQQKLQPCDIVLLLNNLGGVSNIEIGVILDELISQSLQRGYRIIRLLSGQYMSSIDMKGFSITFMDLKNFQNKQQILDCIDLKTDSPFWAQSIDLTDFKYCQLEQSNKYLQKIELKTQLGQQFKLKIENTLKEVIQNEQNLSNIDGQTGDGDLGFNASRCCKKIQQIIDSLDFENNLQNSLIEISNLINNQFGGTSGPLWAGFLKSSALQLPQNLDQIDKKTWENAYYEGLNNMMLIGGAKKGDRTMVDALLQGKENLLKGAILIDGIRQGCENVKSMQAKKGRSTYIGDKVIGLQDAGCELSAIIFSSLLK